MNYRITVSRRAEHDLQHIYCWIWERSPDGAIRWYQAFLKCSDQLSASPHSFSLASDLYRVDIEVRQALFKTRLGRRYRIVFALDEQEKAVRILRVRGPGQPPLLEDEI